MVMDIVVMVDGFNFICNLSVSHLAGWKFINHVSSHSMSLLRSSWLSPAGALRLPRH